MKKVENLNTGHLSVFIGGSICSSMVYHWLIHVVGQPVDASISSVNYIFLGGQLIFIGCRSVSGRFESVVMGGGWPFYR